jgi:uncharacterized repeat protein (TIGR02543 family)
MAVTLNKKSYTIRGITYNVKSTFKCYAANTGRGDSEGGGGTSAALTKGATYTFLGYATDNDTGKLTAYPFMVGDSAGNGLAWFKENVFPYKTYTVTYNANGGSGAPAAGTKNHGVAYTLSTTKPTRTGYTFLGWNTSSTATTASHQPGGTTQAGTNQNIVFYAIWKANTYTVAYNANGGSGSMASGTFTYGTKKATAANTFTKTGYSFNGWQAYRASDTAWAYGKDGGTTESGWYKEGSQPSGYTKIHYSSGFSYTKGSSKNGDTITLYAQWAENYLTVNYYSNYATEYNGTNNLPSGAVVNKDNNTLICTQKFYYDNPANYGLNDYTSGSTLGMIKTGYSRTNKWGTSTSTEEGIKIAQNTTFDTGQALAQAFGKDLSSGNASINVYAQWTENYLTVNYYSNYATEYNGTSTLPSGAVVNKDNNTLICTKKYLYDNAYTDGLNDYTSGSTLGMIKTGYTGTNKWGTSTDGGTQVAQNTSFDTGHALAQAFGKDISSTNDSIDVYAQWTLSCCAYIDNGSALDKYLIYIDDGTNWNLYVPFIDDGEKWSEMGI